MNVVRLLAAEFDLTEEQVREIVAGADRITPLDVARISAEISGRLWISALHESGVATFQPDKCMQLVLEDGAQLYRYDGIKVITSSGRGVLANVAAGESAGTYYLVPMKDGF